MTAFLDMRTVLIGDIAAVALCTFVIGHLWIGGRRRLAGIGLWLVDFVMQFVALLLIAMRGLLPDFVSMVVANGLVVGGTILLVEGLARNLEVRRRRVQDYVLLVAFLGAHTYFAVVHPSLMARNISLSAALLLLSIEVAWIVFRRLDRARRASAWQVGLVFIFYGAVSLVRIVLASSEPQVSDLFRSSLFDTATVLTYEMLFVALTFALFLLVNNTLFEELDADIARRTHAEAALSLSEQKFSIAFKNMPDAIMLTSAESGRIFEANDGFFEMTGLTADGVLGATTIDLRLWAEAGDRDRLLALLDESGRVVEFEASFRRSNGATFPGSISSEIIEIDGKPCILSVIRDLTETKRARAEILRLNSELEARVKERTEELYSANEELQAANEELGAVNEELQESNLRLEEATRAKSDFLSSMSHELRTPLNSIIGFSGVMLQGLAGPLAAEQRRQIGMINNSGRHLLDLVNGVLDLAKIESGTGGPTIGRTDVCAVAREMFDTVRPLAEAKGIETRWECPDDPGPVLTDARCVGQILLNLLGNAVKFTDEGSITTTVSRDDRGVTISVADTGRGIAPEDQARIFEDFSQVMLDGGGKIEGTGLGLAVSRRLGDSIGATIEVTSDLDHGSTFVLRLPDHSI